jgi:hypothetical protein
MCFAPKPDHRGGLDLGGEVVRVTELVRLRVTDPGTFTVVATMRCTVRRSIG